jgi:Flp pilus assembly protein TadG
MGSDLMRRVVGRPGGRDEGAAAVEFALVAMLLITLVFGIIEFSLLLRDNVAITSLARNGARIASSEPRKDTMPSDVVNAVNVSGSAIPKDSIDEMWIYKAGSNGYPVGTSDFSSCTPGVCVKYFWNDARDRFGPASNTMGWPANSQNACIGDANSMSVGVYIKATHKYVTGAGALIGLGSTATVADHAVMHFEPLPNRDCGRGLS